VPSKSANVKNEKQHEVLKDNGWSKQRAAGSGTLPRSRPEVWAAPAGRALALRSCPATMGESWSGVPCRGGRFRV